MSLFVIISACGDDSTSPIFDGGTSDAGPADAGAIRFDAGPDVLIPDAGNDTDAGGDAGTDDAGTDAGDAGAPGECLFSIEEGLSDACFPACVEGSLRASIGCADYECLLEIFQMGDGTGLDFDSGSTVDNVFYQDYLIRVVEATESCHQCETLVTRACEFDVCPDEVNAFFDCMRGLTGETSCFPRSNAVYECANLPANQGTYLDCYGRGLNRCFQ